MRILLVDDSKFVHSVIKPMLKFLNPTEIISAFNGQEALKILKENRPFDLILLDWEMPILDGPKTFEQIKATGCVTPIIMVTSIDDPERIQDMITKGASEYVMKPFTEDILKEKIEMVLQNRLSA